jgi:homoserine acetyltransferase
MHLFTHICLYVKYYSFLCSQAEHPVYWSVKEWCEGFRKLLDYLGLHKVHIFGASLGKMNFSMWAYMY